MAYYSDDIIAEVAAANDIVDLVSGYVRLKRSGSGYMGCCPFHREKTPSFHVSADKQLYHCFGCGAGGSVIQFVMNAEGLDFAEAIKFLAQRGGVALPENGVADSTAHQKKQRMYDINRVAARFFREKLLEKGGTAAQNYLIGRGLTGKTVAAFGLGYSPPEWDSLLKHLQKNKISREEAVQTGLCIVNDKGHTYDRFRGRIMYPIIDPRGNIIGFGGRIIDGDGAKYMNSPESAVYDKGKNLFALNIAKKSKRGYYILVEGYMDVISLHQAGVDCAVAGCGTALTRDQARLIAKSTVYLCYDSDEAGQKALDRAAQIFAEFETRLRVISIPKCKDADEYIKKFGGQAFEKLIKNAKTVTEHKLDALLYGVDTNDPAQQIELIKNAARLFSQTGSALEREIYVKKLSAKSGISTESILSEVRKISSKDKNKQLLGELKRAVGTQPGVVQSRVSRRMRAERGLLALICSDCAVYDKLKERINAHSFADEIHKKIYENAARYYSDGKKTGCDRYLLTAMADNQEELSAILMSEAATENPQNAAEDFAAALEEEIFEERLAAAQKSGDIQLISQLLKEKKQKGGK